MTDQPVPSLSPPDAACPHCGVALDLSSPGWYECEACGGKFAAEKKMVVERVEWEIHAPAEVAAEHAVPNSATTADLSSSTSSEPSSPEMASMPMMAAVAKADGDALDRRLRANADPAEFALFVPLQKVDEEQRMVYGYASLEQPDHAGEIMDYASSKPLFMQWSQDAIKRSGGKSKGNLRSMHSNIAAGKLTDLQTDDARRGFPVAAKVTNDAEWKQVLEGVYTGFSVGGRYAKRWYDSPTGLMRYTAEPKEISLVDAPAVPGATFQMVKADGATEQRTFKKASSELPGAPAPTQMQVGAPETYKVGKSPETFTPITININLVPEGDQLRAAVVPGERVVSGGIDAAPAGGVAKEDDPDPAPQPERAPEGAPPTMKKDKYNQALDSARSLLTQVREAGPGASDALSQAMAVLDTLVDQAPLEQDSALPSEAQSAARSLSTTMTDDGPTSTSTVKSAPATTSTTSSSPSSSTESSTPTVAKSESEPEGVQKAMSDQPLATQPPVAEFHIDQTENVLAQKLPAFQAALERGNLRKAQEVADWDQQQFDDMFAKSAVQILTKGGWTYKNLGRINANVPDPFSPQGQAELQKAIQLADMPNYYLMRLAKLMLPLYAGLRRRMPFQTPPVGSNMANWRAQLGNGAFSFAGALSVAENNNGQAVPTNFLNFSTPFKRTAVNDAVTLEAVYGARGYDDPLQVAVIRALTMLLGVEERMILGGNSGSIPAPASVTAAVGSGGALGSATAYTVYVASLTYRGWLYLGEGSAAPFPAGESTAASGSVAVPANSSIVSATWPAVPGAVAYNVYLSNGTYDRYATTVTVNKVSISSTPGSTNGSHPGANTTANANGFEGIIPWAELSTIYGNAISGKSFTDQGGAALTATTSGVSEFDTLLSALWVNWQLAPSLILTSANGAKHLTNKLTGASPSAYRLEVSQERGTVKGGMFVTGYINKFAPYADGTPRVIDIMAHPYLADGSFLFLTESVPYPMSKEARGWAVEGLIPYTYFPLAQTTPQYPFAMLFSETLECFHPGAQAAIVGVDVSN